MEALQFLVAPLGAAVSGAVLWSLLEYALHRGLGHRPGRLEFTREHMAHHRDPDYFAPAWRKARTALPIAALAFAAACSLATAAGAAWFAGGFLGAYVAYEVLHRRIHTHPPRGFYSRWARRHHLHHHFHSPLRNHGVTTPLWDWVLGTLERPAQIRVPARHAMRWLCDEAGVVAAPFRRDYALFRHAEAGTAGQPSGSGRHGIAGASPGAGSQRALA